MDTPPARTISSKEDDGSSETRGEPVSEVESIGPRVQPSDLPWSLKGQSLAMILLLNCASYWFSSSLGPLKTILKGELSLNNSHYAVIAAAGNLVNTVVPVISGVAIDYYGPESLSLGASSVLLLGAIIAGVGASTNSYASLLVGEIVVGLGSVTIETAQLKMYTTLFRGSHLGFIFGLNHAFNHLINLTAKATAVPISQGSNSWTWAIWVPAFISAFSLAINAYYCVIERNLPSQYRLLPGRHFVQAADGHRGFRTELFSAWRILNDLPGAFWLITLTQASRLAHFVDPALIGPGQLFQDATVQSYIVLSPSILTVTRGASQLSAGLIAALAQVPVIVFSPLVGYVMDRWGHRMHFSPAASLFFIIVYSLNGWTQVNAIALSIIQGVALALNFIPFTLAVGVLVPSLQHMGTAQGTYSAFINAAHVIILTASGAIQDASPTGRHSYDNVLYLFLAIKVIDVFLGFFYILWDRVALDSILTRSEQGQKERDAKIASGPSTFEHRRARLRSPKRSWTVAGLITGAILTVVAWTVYITFSVR